MVVTARDGNGGALLYQYEQYFDARNGDSLVTTLDTTIQYYLEKGLEELESRYGTGVGATGIVMDVYTDMPGVQFYSGNFLKGEKGKSVYHRNSGFCLETQFFPNAINNPDFSAPILRAGQQFYSKTVYQFSTKI